MPANTFSVILLILIDAAEAILRLWPYLLAGILLSAILSRLAYRHSWTAFTRASPPLAMAVAAVSGVLSPLSTIGMVPVVLELRREGLSGRVALAFILASSLLNPQLLILTVGALGFEFALAQLLCVLLVSAGAGAVFGRHVLTEGIGVPDQGAKSSHLPSQLISMVEHVGLSFLLGIVVASTMKVLLPQLGLLNWLGERGWLSTPLMGWMGAPFYACGGSAVPLAAGLVESGIAPGALFLFLFLGPALRGTTLGALGCILPKRAQLACLATLVLGSIPLGYVFGSWIGAVS